MFVYRQGATVFCIAARRRALSGACHDDDDGQAKAYTCSGAGLYVGRICPFQRLTPQESFVPLSLSLCGCGAAQELFKSHVCADTLLVGHALDNDLRVLRVLHGRVLDTSVMYPHPRGPPYKSALKVLCRKFLKRSIQDGSHDSVVDARVALELAQLKIKHGARVRALHACMGMCVHALKQGRICWHHASFASLRQRLEYVRVGGSVAGWRKRSGCIVHDTCVHTLCV